jgi:hypothetical protein
VSGIGVAAGADAENVEADHPVLRLEVPCRSAHDPGVFGKSKFLGS